MRVYIQKEEPVLKVIGGQALTPAQMDHMRKRGQSITSFQVDETLFNDGTTNPKFEIPITDQRGVDVVDVWNAQKDAKANVKKFNKQSDKHKIVA